MEQSSQLFKSDCTKLYLRHTITLYIWEFMDKWGCPKHLIKVFQGLHQNTGIVILPKKKLRL